MCDDNVLVKLVFLVVGLIVDSSRRLRFGIVQLALEFLLLSLLKRVENSRISTWSF